MDDIDAEVVEFEGGDPDDVEATVREYDGEHEYRVEVRCDSTVRQDDATVTLGIEASGIPTVALERKSGPIDVRCSPQQSGGFRSVNADDIVGPNPTTQDLSFTMDGRLSKGETVTIDLSGIIVSYDDAEITDIDGSHQHDSARFTERDGTSATIEFEPHNQLKAGDDVQITIDGVEIGWDGFGFAVFTESETGQQELSWFDIDRGGSAGTFETQTSDDDGPTTVTDSELERAVDESDEFDTRQELLDRFAETDDIRYVGAD
ncbi:hypothetical protein GS429_21595 [Natronorubrum sp. JWXQ-INN-674]|uniref:Uncharacterized protein n=1 Tax=Natronorubrum halalkaliphilum TaxID=2691917 RepID=A0A6B0VRY4_9EURY|nr:hypothetical protein [Natronorubrum halalkaliphilum]MXV64621.1 hypothetical protein [Natronorubrum halalkaliphilum]